MYKIVTNKENLYFKNEEELANYAVEQSQKARVFSSYCRSKNKTLDRTIEVLGDLGYIVEDEDLDIEDKEGDYEANVLYAEMVAEQVISY